MDSWANLGNVKKLLELVEQSPEAEKYIREFVAGAAANVPLELLVKLGEAVVEFRQAELQKEAEQN